MNSLVELAEQSDIDRVLVIYDDLIQGINSNDAIVVLDDLANQGNLYAAYVLGSCYLFGMPPRHYDFNRTYSKDQFSKVALVPKDEKKAFGYYFQLLNFGDEVEQYQLEGVYDFYRILKGDAPIFNQFHIELRPKEGDHSNDFLALFENADEIMAILKEFDYYESYIDIAKYYMRLFNSSNDKAQLDTALAYLDYILNPNGRYFSQADDLQATLQLIDVYLHGNAFMPADIAMAKSIAVKSKFDKALIAILDYMESNKITDATELEPILSRIVDNSLRFDQRIRFNLPYSITPTDRLAKMWSLFGVKTPIMSDMYQSTSSAAKVVEVEQQDERPASGAEAVDQSQEMDQEVDDPLFEEEAKESAAKAQADIRKLLQMAQSADDEINDDDTETDDEDNDLQDQYGIDNDNNDDEFNDFDD